MEQYYNALLIFIGIMATAIILFIGIMTNGLRKDIEEIRNILKNKEK